MTNGDLIPKPKTRTAPRFPREKRMSSGTLGLCPDGDAPRHVLIVGGGASGVLMAAHLLSRSERVRVTLVEPREKLGRGLAYETRDPDHLLNTRVSAMSAFPDDPGHFLRWLRARGHDVGAQDFVSRRTYGAYLGDLLTPWQEAMPSRLLRLRQSCVRLEETRNGVRARLDDDSTVKADIAILATGHSVPKDPAGALTGGWEDPGPVPPEARVVIVGTGLSMVDQALSLLNRGHRGEIVAISRRGLLPRPHTTPSRPVPVAGAEVPLGAPVSELLHWLRGLVRQAEAQGRTWQDAVDGMRPHVSAIWQAMPLDARRRFLRHCASRWEVHRHRIPPASALRISEAMARGQLILRRGAFVAAERDDRGGFRALIRPCGEWDIHALRAARLIDCRGIRTDPEQNASPLIAGLLAAGKARVDPLRLGLVVDGDCRLIGRDGSAAEKIFAIGPVTKAIFWEITAVPDIRVQTAEIASRLLPGPEALPPRTDGMALTEERHAG